MTNSEEYFIKKVLDKFEALGITVCTDTDNVDKYHAVFTKKNTGDLIYTTKRLFRGLLEFGRWATREYENILNLLLSKLNG